MHSDTIYHISSIISCLGGSHNNLVLRQTLMPTTSVKATEGRRTVLSERALPYRLLDIKFE